MAEVFSIAIFFVIILITALLFFGWVAFVILRAVFNGIAGMFHAPRRMGSIGNGVVCPTRGCGASNPPHAHFCRRCGTALSTAHRVHVRRAAVW